MDIDSSLSTRSFLGDISMRAVEIVSQILKYDRCLYISFESSGISSPYKGDLQVYSSELKAECLGTLNILVKGIHLPLKEFKTLSCARQTIKLKAIDLLRCLNSIDTSIPTVIFLVYICEENESHCCFYNVFYPQMLKTIRTYEEINACFWRYDVFLPRQSLFFNGILHHEKRCHYFLVLCMLEKELHLRNWFQYIWDACNDCFPSELINGCEKIFESISCYEESEDPDSLAISISILRNVLSDFLETLYCLSVTSVDHAGKLYYKTITFNTDVHDNMIPGLMKNQFYNEMDYIDAGKQEDIQYLFDLYKLTLLRLLWEIGAAINNILYCFRCIYGEYHFFNAELGHKNLYLYETKCYIRHSSKYNLGYNCYLNLKEFEMCFPALGVELAYTPSKYSPYPGLKRIKEIVRGNMAR